MLIDDTTICYEKTFEILVIILLISWRIYLKLRIKPTNSYVCLIGKTAIITGGNKGIGFYTALDLAKRGAKVILACKNEREAILSVKKIIYQTNNENISYKILNLESFQSIKSFANDIIENEEKIDILINNAGVAGFGDVSTEDNLQKTFQVNYLGPFLLTNLLIDTLKKSKSARIVNVASHMAKYGKINQQIDDYPHHLHNIFAKIQMYASSKLCLIYFTIELAKKLNGSNVNVNVLHPGGVKSGIFRRLPFQPVVKFISKTWFKTLEEGSRTSIYLATSRNVEKVSGKMFDNCTQVPLEKYVKDFEIGNDIWKQSEMLVSLKNKESF